MALGIVRAKDQGAFWREAADEIPQETWDHFKAPTSEPPKGASSDSAGQGVTIPNSNKFKPVNGLKKLLDDIPPDDSGYAPGTHPDVANWLANHPAWVNPYLKPGYASAIKHVLGDDNYAKLLHHMPGELKTKLTTHAQLPAPNSNKYKTPTNGLKKLLDHPETTSAQVKSWMDTHPAYVKGYLQNPEYQDAIKGDLGEANHKDWSEVLGLPGATSKPEYSKSKGQEVADSAAKAMGPAGFKPMTTDQFFAPGGPAGPQTGPKPSDQDDIKAIQDELNKGGTLPEDQPAIPNSPHYDAIKDKAENHPAYKDSHAKDIIATPGFHEWFHSHTKDKQAELAKSPSSTTFAFLKWLEKHPQTPSGGYPSDAELDAVGITPEAPNAGQEITPKLSPEDQGEADAIKQQAPAPAAPAQNQDQWPSPELLSDYKGVFPNHHPDLEKMSDDQLKLLMENQLKFLPDHPGYKQFLPKLQAVYDKHFGAGAAKKVEEEPEQWPEPGGTISLSDDDEVNDDDDPYAGNHDPGFQQLLDADDDINEGMHKDLFKTPEFQKWWATQGGAPGTISEAQKYFMEFPSDAVKTFNEDQAMGGGDAHEDDPWGSDAEGMHPIQMKESDDALIKKMHETVLGNSSVNGMPTLEQWAKGVKDNAAANGVSVEDYLKGSYPISYKKVKAEGLTGGEFGDQSTPGNLIDFIKLRGYNPDGLTPEKLQTFKDEYEKLKGNNTGGVPNGGDATEAYKKLVPGSSWNLTDPDEAKHLKTYLQTVLGNPEDHKVDLTINGQDKTDEFKQFYDQYFGPGVGGSAIPGGSESSSTDDGSFTPAGLGDGDANWSPNPDDLEELFAQGKVTKTQLAILQDKGSEWWKEHYQKLDATGTDSSSDLWKALYSIKPSMGDQTPQAQSGPMVPQSVIDHALGDSKFAEQWASHLKIIGQQTPEKFQANIDYVKKQIAQGAGSQYENTPWIGLIQAYDELHSGVGTPSGGSAKPFDPQSFAEDYAKIYNANPNVFNIGGLKFKDMTAQQAKSHLEGKIGPDTNPKFQEIYDKYFGNAGEGKPGDIGYLKEPEGPPPFDPKGFKSEFGALFPGSSWIKSYDGQNVAEAEQKLKGLVESGDANFPDSDKTNQAHVLYEKYFGKGLPKPPPKAKQTAPPPDESNFSKPNVHPEEEFSPSSVEEEQEDPEAVSAPFKTEDLKPEEMAHWSSAKPGDPTAWKNFAEWWGKTKMDPAQEKQLYSSWFPGKNATPEFAHDWFQHVFEYHSKPGGGDLGLEQPPSWAHNSWAFGDDADKEWPLFSQWAASDPGLPSGLGVKQKLQIWKGLGKGDKAEIAENYNPSNPVDSKAVVDALKKAYPDSDWSAWAKMPQGTLKNSVETLAKAGFDKAIPLYNSTYGGSIPMPKAEEKSEEEAAAPPPLKVVPIEQLPGWVKNYYGEDEKSAVLYTKLQKFGDAIGQGDIVKNGDPNAYSKKPVEVITMFNSMPDYLKDMITEAPPGSLPFHDKESFMEWTHHAPKPLDDIKALYPDGKQWDSYWDKLPVGYYKDYQKEQLGGLIENESDPMKKNALLGAYYKYFGGNKPTLAQSLKDIYPGEDWDQKLKGSTTDAITKELKKRLKTEKDPEKWVALVDTFGKYIGGNSGIKQVTNGLKGHSPGQPVDVGTLKELLYWKKALGGDPGAGKPNYWTVNNWDHNSNYIKSKANDNGGEVLPYHGWTPPGHKGGGFQTDPAMLGKAGPSYSAPPAEATGEAYDTLVNTVKKKKVSFSKDDLKTVASEEFQSWFQHAPKGYRDTFKYNPGIAIDDFKGLLEGNMGYQTPAGGDDWSKVKSGPAKSFDVAFPSTTKSKGKSKVPGYHNEYQMWPGWTENPEATLGTGRPDEHLPEVDVDPNNPNQLEIPLPPNQKWEAHGEQPLYRALSIDLPSGDPNKMHPTDKAGKLLKRIKQIISGQDAGSTLTDTPTLFDPNFKPTPWDKKPPSGGEETLKFLQYVKKNDIPEDQMYSLAKQWGVPHPEQYGPPPVGGIPGTYDHPELAGLILDYLHLSSNEGGFGSTGLGIHWTTSEAQGHKPPSSVSVNMNPSDTHIPIVMSALWGGAGEDPGRSGGANGYPNEKEITLSPGALLKMMRLELKTPEGKYVDLMNHDGTRPHLPGPHQRVANLRRANYRDIEAHIASLEMQAEWDPESGTVDPAKMWNNFGELDTHNPGTGAGMLGHQPPPVQHKKTFHPGDHPSDAAKYAPKHYAIQQMEANIDRICREADRKAEAWLHEADVKTPGPQEGYQGEDREDWDFPYPFPGDKQVHKQWGDPKWKDFWRTQDQWTNNGRRPNDDYTFTDGVKQMQYDRSHGSATPAVASGHRDQKPWGTGPTPDSEDQEQPLMLSDDGTHPQYRDYRDYSNEWEAMSHRHEMNPYMGLFGSIEARIDFLTENP